VPVTTTVKTSFKYQLPAPVDWGFNENETDTANTLWEGRLGQSELLLRRAIFEAREQHGHCYVWRQVADWAILEKFKEWALVYWIPEFDERTASGVIHRFLWDLRRNTQWEHDHVVDHISLSLDNPDVPSPRPADPQ